MKVVWLASWYPNRINPSAGDFIERHAKAVAKYTEQLFVIAVIKDDAIRYSQVEIEKTTEGNLTVYKAYYGKTRWGGLIEKIFSFRKYLSLQRKIYKEIVTTAGKPDLLHVNVAMKAGLFATRVKKSYGIPYIVTEHWGGYYKECVPNIYDSGRNFIRMNNTVLRQAALLCPVSNALGKKISQDFVPVKSKVIANVVDTRLFYYHPYSPPKFRFIHASYLGYQKNPEGMMQACVQLKARGYDFELLLLGNEDKKLEAIAGSLGLLNTEVFFKAAVPYEEVAKEMQRSSALLLFSRYENLPCVMLEALCCGLPVISTKVGGVPEVIDDHNGILVDNENIDQLVNAMQQLIHSYSTYNREAISTKASSQFNYDVIGRQYLYVYQDIVQKDGPRPPVNKT